MLTNNQDNRGIIGHGCNNIVNSGSGTIQINESEDELVRLLGRRISADALCTSFYSPPECNPNTRTTIRNEINAWIDESASKQSPLLWLNGPAGVGKSVIAKTISRHDQVVATFFFSTSSDRSAARLLPTLAWQLARRIPETRKHIIASLKDSISLQTSQIEMQFNHLIVQPLKQIATTLNYRPVMVIDGVDECTDERMLAQFLRVLAQAGERIDMPVRFIICSRPEPWIHAILGGIRSDVDPIANRQELPSPILGYQRRVTAFASMTLVGSIGSSKLIASIALTPTSSSESEITIVSLILTALIILLGSIGLMGLLGLIALVVPRPNSESHRSTPMHLGQVFKEVWELYRPVWLGIDKDAPSFPTPDRLVDTDKICPHPVISVIQICLSQECKDDIARYLTDKFNAIRGDGTSPWFQRRDISFIVEASCCQFLYAATIVRLLDEFQGEPVEVLEMACNSALPTPDLNKLYKAILKRAENTIQNQAKEGGPNYEKERRFLMDSLAILVFFAGNIHFFTVQKSSLVIETLLGLEKGKLTSKLRKMHSVLRIVPEAETIQVHHRSFLEFVQNRERSGEYYIGYSNGLRRILVLMARTGLRDFTIHIYKQSESSGLGCVQDMVAACHLNLFGRSRSPYEVTIIHFYIYGSLILTFLILLSLPLLICLDSLTVPVLYLIDMGLLCVFLSFIGSYILSLTIYTLCFNRSIIVPFFHPFLHPVFMGGFLFSIRSVMVLLFAPIIAIVILQLAQLLY